MKVIILEIYELTNRVILIAEFEKDEHPHAGMYIKSAGVYFKILSVGLKRNLAYNPKYKEVLNEKNILDFDIVKSQEVLTCVAVGMVVDLVANEYS